MCLGLTLAFRVSGSGFRVSNAYANSGFGFRMRMVSGFGFRMRMHCTHVGKGP